MSEEKKIIEPSGYIHPDNVKRLADGETVAFRKKPYAHDGGGIPVFVGTAPVSAEPTETELLDVAERIVQKWQDQERMPPLAWDFRGFLVDGMRAALKAVPVAAQAQPMKVTSHETIDWTEISKRGLLERINREIMHPLGLAVYRCVETGVSGSALVSPDGVWTYEEDSGQAQQPVSGADGLPPMPEGNCATEVGGSSHNPPIYFESDMIEYARAALAQQDAALHAEVLNMVLMLEANEWADHCGKSDLGRRLEWAITVLQNRIAELTKSSNQQDADKVQAELLSSLVEIVDAVIASDEEGLIEHSETIIKARAAIDAARKAEE